MSKKKSSDIGMFVIGWIASALAVAIPLVVLIMIQKNLPNEYEKYGDKISVIAYLAGAFFSGLFASYRVSCKSDEKDEIISGLESQIESSKKAYSALSPKSKIIGLLHELHTASNTLGKPGIQKLIMRKIGEINDDSLFDPRYDGMINQIDDDQFKESRPQKERNQKNPKSISISIMSADLFKKTDANSTKEK